MDADSERVVPALIEALETDSDAKVRTDVAQVLGDMDLDPKDGVKALVALVELLIKAKDNNSLSEYATGGKALAQISDSLLLDIGKLDTSDLKQAISGFSKLENQEWSDDHIKQSSSKLRQELHDRRLFVRIERWVDENIRFNEWINERDLDKIRKSLLAMGVFISVGTIWLVVFFVSPLALLRINDFMKKAKIENFKVLGISIPLRSFLLVGLLYRSRVLDAWVRKHLPGARTRFEEMPTVADRCIHITSVPFHLKGETHSKLSPRLIRNSLKGSKLWRLVIHGEGGVGKTSFACCLARWAMSDDKDEWIANHPMIPVLIEREIDEDNFLTAVQGHLRELIEAEEVPSDELVEKLLRKRRLLVIADHLSEMSAKTRDRIKPIEADFPANALIITSRSQEEDITNIRTLLEPQRIEGERLTIFMHEYLVERRRRADFNDSEYVENCKRLVEMVGHRDITPLFAKLFAEMMIASKEDSSFEELPDNIPDLMLSYLNWINRNRQAEEPDNLTVQRIARVAAWTCLEPTFLPAEGAVANIHNALSGEEDLEKKIDYLATDLGIIRLIGPAQDAVLISLDPLAEYLAGLQLIELLGSDEEKWRQFLDEADKKEAAPEAIKGFLLAVRDCCLTQRKTAVVPDFVAPELAKRAGLATQMPQEAY
jgi:HEAT repeat protein